MTATTSALEAPQASVEALLAAVNTQREQARRRMLEALISKRFEALVLRIARSLREQVTPGSPGGVTIGELAPRVLEARYRAFCKPACRLTPKSPPAAFHEVRRRARRLRFTAEFLEDVYGRPAEELIEAATELQDIFGEHQDCYAAIDLRRRACASLPEAAVSLARRLDEQDLVRAASLRKAGPDAVKRVTKRWKALRKAMRA